MANGTANKPFSIISKDISGTTDSNGVLVTNLSRNEYYVLYITSGGTLCLPYVQLAGEGGNICIKCVDPAIFNPRVNTPFSSIQLHLIHM